MKKYVAGISAAVSLLTMSASFAADLKDWTITGNAGLYSDYRFRGYTQTAYKPAFQGGFDIAHTSGFYIGNWNSNVEQKLYRGATLEMDFYTGYKFNAGPIGMDLGGIYYYYPSGGKEDHRLKQNKQGELYVAAAYSYFTAKFSYGLTNFFGLGDGTPYHTTGNYYVDIGFNYDLGQGYGINAHYGYQHVPHGKLTGLIADDASDYKIGLTKDFNGWVVGGTVVATNRKNFAMTGANPDKGAGKSGVVVSLSKTF